MISSVFEKTLIEYYFGVSSFTRLKLFFFAVIFRSRLIFWQSMASDPVIYENAITLISLCYVGDRVSIKVDNGRNSV